MIKERRDRHKDLHGGVITAPTQSLELGSIARSTEIELLHVVTGTISLEGTKKILIGAFIALQIKQLTST